MTEIAIKIVNQVIQLAADAPRLVAGSAGVYAVTLAYDAQWDDATVRVVVFDGGLCNSRVSVQDTTGTVTIPAECIAHGGRGNWLQIGVLGYDGTGALRITTRAMLDGLRIDPAGVSDADVPQDPPTATPGLWEQLVADVGNLSDLQTADTSSLVAAINDLAAKPAGYKPYPVTLTQNGKKWTADHTLDEVKGALAQGYSPYCVYMTFPIPCAGVEDNYVFYSGWIGTQTKAVWVMQSKSGVTVIDRNTFGVDYLTNLVDDDGSFGRLNTLIGTNPRTAVVYNLGGTPEGQDLSGMTFPALLWGTVTDQTARTNTVGLLGVGGDQWTVTRQVDTGAVTFERVSSGGVLVDATLTQEGQAADAAVTGASLKFLQRLDVAQCYYFWDTNSPGSSNDILNAYNRGAPAAIVSAGGGEPASMASAVPPYFVIFGAHCLGHLPFTLTDARANGWGGSIDLSKSELTVGQQRVQSLGLTSAAVGQIAKITAVDTDGKPTAWEAVDMPSGGGDEWVSLYDGTIDVPDAVWVVRANLARSDTAKEYQMVVRFAANTAADWGSNKTIDITVNGAQLGKPIASTRLNSMYQVTAVAPFEGAKLMMLSQTASTLAAAQSPVLTQTNTDVAQTHTGKIQISFAAQYAGSITVRLWGRY